MDLNVLLVVLGLVVFEVISSIDNAVVNADVLSTMKNEKAKRFFLTWGIFFAIVIVRGVLPFIIVYATNSQLGISGVFNAMLNSDPSVQEAIEKSAPMLLIGGGMFLFLLFIHWLLMEEKEFGFSVEKTISDFGSVWFYGLASLTILVSAIYLSREMTFAAIVGYTAFFITGGFKENAKRAEERMMASGGDTSTGMSDWSKVLFLEVIDTTFSIDGVVGAFAFTMSVPLILLGNGIGAIVVRQITIGNVERIKKYAFLKNGAMYSIGFLGAIMITEGVGYHVPSWLSPVITVSTIGYFLNKSIKKNKEEAKKVAITA
jgi:hypothetical protein